jgi:hypothetical protein
MKQREIVGKDTLIEYSTTTDNLGTMTLGSRKTHINESSKAVGIH